jgi:hypothetical protein
MYISDKYCNNFGHQSFWKGVKQLHMYSLYGHYMSITWELQMYHFNRRIAKNFTIINWTSIYFINKNIGIDYVKYHEHNKMGLSKMRCRFEYILLIQSEKAKTIW